MNSRSTAERFFLLLCAFGVLIATFPKPQTLLCKNVATKHEFSAYERFFLLLSPPGVLTGTIPKPQQLPASTTHQDLPSPQVGWRMHPR